jgi:pyridoxamine 5'-phosphate oxidase
MPNSQDFVSDAEIAAPGRDPLSVLNAWYEEAASAGDALPDAMTLATADKQGRPSARVVLFKGIVRGAVFFVTSYGSRKARELDENPRAALVMHYPPRERQVRLEGRVERASAAESETYFRQRPRGSQLGAWASPQSQPIASRAELDSLTESVEARFGAGEVPRPESWGGYLVFPDMVELWLGRPDRLHDRFVYRRGDGDTWQIQRLAP